ncbi:MAG TPA: malto-oligosyltrehalose trehalohydrolase [Vicinamibacterales bacterium]|nr:malto-oligosyltrehalose trehalohydrolase [Vicinamibacterales bacterium]
MPIGAEVQPAGGIHFRVWAPRCRRVAVETARPDAPAGESVTVALASEPGGYFAGLHPQGRAGDLYWFRLDDDETRYPDPASRFQPQGPRGPSEIVDPSQFHWTDQGWRGLKLAGQVMYEVHVGTYTRDGTFDALTRELPRIAELGVTVLEVMPVADFPGRFGWGYDGVCLFAPTRLYGRPDDLRRLVDRAHAIGMGVILDVVYNHLGPDGNFLTRFTDTFFAKRKGTDWGDAINFDGEGSEGVREFVIQNAAYWIDEFHFDGLRLDATHAINDRSSPDIVTDVARQVRERAAGRDTIVVAENESQEAALVRPVDRGGCGLDGLWNDDFQHSALVALTGRREAYYTDYLGTAGEFVAMAKRGFLYQGQLYSWQKKHRGKPTDGIPRSAFITFVENHDQVANSARGERLHQLSAPGTYRAMTALLLLGPNTPLLFQGQEFASSAPFLFFADHHPELARAVREGRRAFLAQFPSIATEAAQAALAPPEDPHTFERCRLDLSERERNAAAYAMHRDLLTLRRGDPVFGADDVEIDGAALGASALVLRFFGGPDGDRLLLVNLGSQLNLDIVNEPLLAPPENQRWRLMWSSDDPKYGGEGAPHVERWSGWMVPGQAAVALTAERRRTLLPWRK